jgi:hypothetical protein
MNEEMVDEGEGRGPDDGAGEGVEENEVWDFEGEPPTTARGRWLRASTPDATAIINIRKAPVRMLILFHGMSFLSAVRLGPYR